MEDPDGIVAQINELIGCLIEVGLADRNYAVFRRDVRHVTEITFSGASGVSIALKDRSYADIYQQMIELGAYNAKMLDGALIQMMYMFTNGQLQSHRLAFFPSPNLEEFQNNPDIYLTDELYADIVAKNIVSFPIRFDYEASEHIFRQLEHPKSHMTLGQYEHCRIPVTAPVTPYKFIEFIVRNFYHTGFTKYADRLPVFESSFPESISESERKVMHMAVPIEEVAANPDSDGVQGTVGPKTP